MFAGHVLTFGQPVYFDSTNYVKHYSERWNKTFPFKTDLTEAEKLQGLSICWAEAKYNFANFDQIPSLDWDSLYLAYIPKVKNTNSILEYYRTLGTFIRELKDGHSQVMAPREMFDSVFANVPVMLKWVEGQPVVWKVFTKEQPWAAVPVGAIVESVNGMPIQDYIRKNVSPYVFYHTPQDSLARLYSFNLFAGKADQSVTITVRDAKGQKSTHTLPRQTASKIFEPRFGLLEFEVLPGNIGYLQLKSFNDPRIVEQFDSLFAEISATDALIIDVRLNGGGNSDNGYQILGRLVTEPFMQSKSYLRHYFPTGRAWGEPESLSSNLYDWKPFKPNPYTKPVALLIGPKTYSAAEDFTVAFTHIGRGPVFGETTGGSTGQPVFFSLPGGGGAFVCSKRDVFPDGREFMGVGIPPDFTVKDTIEGLRQGRDEALEAAMKHLKKER